MSAPNHDLLAAMKDMLAAIDSGDLVIDIRRVGLSLSVMHRMTHWRLAVMRAEKNCDSPATLTPAPSAVGESREGITSPSGNGAATALIATEIEAATLLKLRDNDSSGPYVGDIRALEVLREFAVEVSQRTARVIFER